MKRQVAPAVRHLLAGRMAIGKRRSPLRDELRAFLALYRQAEWNARLILAAFAKDEQVCASEFHLLAAVQHLRVLSGLPRLAPPGAKERTDG